MALSPDEKWNKAMRFATKIRTSLPMPRDNRIIVIYGWIIGEDGSPEINTNPGVTIWFEKVGKPDVPRIRLRMTESDVFPWRTAAGMGWLDMPKDIYQTICPVLKKLSVGGIQDIEALI